MLMQRLDSVFRCRGSSDALAMEERIRGADDGDTQEPHADRPGERGGNGHRGHGTPAGAEDPKTSTTSWCRPQRA